MSKPLPEIKIGTLAERLAASAAVPLEQVMQLVADELPDFAEVLRRFGSPPIRSTATLAGNIANGSPIGDSMPCLMALGATLVLRQGAKTRSVPLAQFYTGMKQNLLKPAEFIEAIDIPRLKADEVFRAHKISKRFDQDISATCAAIRYRLEAGRLKDVRLAYNGLTPSPARAARLDHGQMDNVMGDDLHRLVDQDGIAMMADGIGPRVERDGHIVRVCFDEIERKRGDTLAEAPVGFLQGDNVCADLVQDIEHAFGPTQAVGADPFPDIVARDLQHVPRT